MPLITRDDGTTFVTRAYRELLTVKGAALIKREVHLLEQANGSFARLFRQDDGSFEAVFSFDAGYLLGETVWHFFEKPENLIYCEILPNSDRAVLVVVRQGSVFLDAEMPVSHLADEFAGLFFDDTAYELYFYGDVPVDTQEYAAEFTLPEESVKSLQQLEESVYLQLPPIEALSLVSVSLALRSIKTDKKGLSPVAIILIVTATGLVSWIAWKVLKPPPPPPPPVIQPKKPPGPPPDPFLAYKKALSSPAPIAILQSAVEQLHRLYGISGWQTKSVKVTLTGINVTLAPGNPAITNAPLRKWAELNQLSVKLEADSATLFLPITATNREAPAQPVLQPLLPLISQVQQRLQTVTLPETIKIGKEMAKEHYQQVDVTVSFNQVAPDYLSYLGNALLDLPIVLTNLNVSMGDGLVNGSVTFSVLGK